MGSSVRRGPGGLPLAMPRTRVQIISTSFTETVPASRVMVGQDTQMGSLQVRWKASVTWVKRKAAVKSRKVHVVRGFRCYGSALAISDRALQTRKRDTIGNWFSNPR